MRRRRLWQTRPAGLRSSWAMFASVSRGRSSARFCGRYSWQRGPRDDIGPFGSSLLVSASPVDFRRGMDSLAMLVTDTLRGDPFCGDLFLFRSKRSDRVKILAWDGTGLVLYSKRLETGHFIWPTSQDGVIALSASQLSVLLDGLDWKKVAPRLVDRPLRAG